MSRDFGIRRSKFFDFFVSRRSYRFPNNCLQCSKPDPQHLESLTSEIGYFKRRVFLGQELEHLRIRVPLCASCAAWRTRWQITASCWSVVVVLVGIAGTNWLDINGWERWVTIFGSVILAAAPHWLLERRLGARLIGYTNDSLHFDFTRQEYAREFATANDLVETIRPNGQVMYLSQGSRKSQRTV
jgi:hypothetical protein